MSKVQILDCTLRDGGYINDFRFGAYGLRKIIAQLTAAHIDIIECGFLEDGNDDPDCSLYTRIDQIAPLLPRQHEGTMYVAMACYGEYDLRQLAPCDGTVEGIRVTFHYNEVEEALRYCRSIQEKGYKVFVQPVGTTSYSDEQLLSLIHEVNRLQPYALSIVDTLGLMHQQDVLRYFTLIDSHLAPGIHMGFHSHNNLQLSYSNCQYFASMPTERTIILDGSVYGMGRGAGNLGTELISNYLNSQHRRYDIEPILEVMDEFIVPIKKEHEWGYSVPYYLAAINGCHPNYASFLASKHTLTVKNIGTILRSIEPERRSLFDKALAEEKYLAFQAHDIDDQASLTLLRRHIEGRNVLLVAPGPSLNQYQERVLQTAREGQCIVVAAAFDPAFIDCHYLFLSNLKRYSNTFSNPHHRRLICTSNIAVDDPNALRVNYTSLLNEEPLVMDNSSLMLLNLLTRLHPARVFLAGMDGYKTDASNYCHERLAFHQAKEDALALNAAMHQRLAELRESLSITFITPSLYE